MAAVIKASERIWRDIIRGATIIGIMMVLAGMAAVIYGGISDSKIKLFGATIETSSVGLGVFFIGIVTVGVVFITIARQPGRIFGAEMRRPRGRGTSQDHAKAGRDMAGRDINKGN